MFSRLLEKLADVVVSLPTIVVMREASSIKRKQNGTGGEAPCIFTSDG